MASMKQIEEKVCSGTPLSCEEGLALLRDPDLLSVGKLANIVRERLHGDITYYNRNLHLNSTNVCEADCLFCSFARLETGMPQAYTMSVEDARKWIEKRYHPDMTEIHIVNGNNPDLQFSYYEELLQMIRCEFPTLHIKAFTGVEIHFFSKLYRMSYEEVLERLVEAGLGSLPGGGAEVFSERVRKKICRDKATADEWLQVHRIAHQMGLKSNCTILYGTIERPEEVIDHLHRLRTLQEETNGFQAFIPLAFHNEGNRMNRLPAPTGMDDLRMMAISRLMLHNIPHVKAYWIMLGVKTAQLAQRFGANDFDGTVTEEKIYHMAGSETPNALTVQEIERQIERAGRTPIERTTLYERIADSHSTAHHSDFDQKENKKVAAI